MTAAAYFPYTTFWRQEMYPSKNPILAGYFQQSFQFWIKKYLLVVRHRLLDFGIHCLAKYKQIFLSDCLGRINGHGLRETK